jgi:hypothetical protein
VSSTILDDGGLGSQNLDKCQKLSRGRGLVAAAALRGEECCLAVVFGGHQAHELRMDKLGFDDADY